MPNKTLDTTVPPLVSLTLVLGGVRSGKSTLAERMIEQSDYGMRGGVYVATADASYNDTAMQERIAVHQARRGDEWRCVEAPLELVATLRQVVAHEKPVLIDCMTLWLTNLLMAERDVVAETQTLLATLRTYPHPVVVVSSETGLGIMPDNVLARTYGDALGLLNQHLVREAEQVFIVIAGLPLMLKESSRH